MPAKSPSSRARRSRPPARAAHPVVAAIFTLGLLALGIATFRFGSRSIAAEYYEYNFGFAIGSLGFSDPGGFRILAGADAIYWGLAFCAFGAMFALWGCGVCLSVFAAKKQPAEPSMLGRGNTWLSFIVLLVAILCLLPPWRLGSLFFYAVSAVLVGSIVYSVRKKRPALPKQVIPGLIIAAIIAINLHLTFIGAGIFLALAAMLFAGIHLLILNPHWMEGQPGEKEPEPSGSFDD